MEELSLSLVLKTTIALALGYVMHRFKKIEERASLSVDEDRVRRLILDKLEPIEVKIEALHIDSKRMENKIDEIIQNLWKSSSNNKC